MNSKFEFLQKSLTLIRYPEHLQHPSWQAWDSADEYLIEHIESSESDLRDKSLYIFNDENGALASWFCQSTNKPANIVWSSDSFVSRKSCELNLAANHCDSSKLTFIDSLHDLTQNLLQKPNLVLLKIPKNNALLIHQLIALSNLVQSDTIIVAAAKSKDIHTSTLKLFEKYLGETTTSLAKKKSRLIFCLPEGTKNHANPFPSVWKTQQPELTVNNHANVFSRQHLDVGGKFLMANLPNCDGKSVIDLGCGNGIVGLAALEKHDVNQMIFIDESYMAVESARLNVIDNFPKLIERCVFHFGNCLDNYTSINDGPPDIILCNPPFHQQHSITDHIADQMFKGSFDILEKGGELRIIGNRHLDYHRRLKLLFGGYTVIASNNKFSILSAVRRL